MAFKTIQNWRNSRIYSNCNVDGKCETKKTASALFEPSRRSSLHL